MRLVTVGTGTPRKDRRHVVIGRTMDNADRFEAVKIMRRARATYPGRGVTFWNLCIALTVQLQVRRSRSLAGELFPRSLTRVGEYFIAQAELVAGEDAL